MVTSSMKRIRANTEPYINERIDREIEARVEFFAEHPTFIPERLRELDKEWDIERVLETSSSVLSLAGLVFGLRRRRKRFLFATMAIQGFFLQHVIQGWCPPLPLARRLGIRTQAEIQRERLGLLAVAKKLRGPTMTKLRDRSR